MIPYAFNKLMKGGKVGSKSCVFTTFGSPDSFNIEYQVRTATEVQTTTEVEASALHKLIKFSSQN